VEAVQKSFSARHERENARRQKLDVAPFDEALASARREERAAVKALEAHRNEHKC